MAVITSFMILVAWVSSKGAGMFVGSAFQVAGKTMNWAADRLFAKDYIGPMDVWIKGTNPKTDEPTMSAVNFRAGVYFDSKTGYVIATVSDVLKVKGDVTRKNETGEPEIVVTRKQLSEGLYNRKGKPIISTNLLSSIFKFTGRAMAFGLKSIFFLPAAPLMALAYTLKKGVDLVKYLSTKPINVYLPGLDDKGKPELKIVLHASVMKNGGYRNADGSPIYNVSQIKGRIVDIENNTVVEMKDIPLLRAWNGRSLNFYVRSLQRLVTPVVWAGKAAWAVAKGLWWGAGKILKAGVAVVKAPFQAVGWVGRTIWGSKENGSVKGNEKDN